MSNFWIENRALCAHSGGKGVASGVGEDLWLCLCDDEKYVTAEQCYIIVLGVYYIT